MIAATGATLTVPVPVPTPEPVVETVPSVRVIVLFALESAIVPVAETAVVSDEEYLPELPGLPGPETPLPVGAGGAAGPAGPVDTRDRRCPPRVRTTEILPARAQRVTVFGFTRKHHRHFGG